MALCTLAALAGRSDTELILLIRAHRARRAAEPTKRGKWKREDYVRGTIELARGHAEQQKTGTWWLVSAERNG